MASIRTSAIAMSFLQVFIFILLDFDGLVLITYS